MIYVIISTDGCSETRCSKLSIQTSFETLKSNSTKLSAVESKKFTAVNSIQYMSNLTLVLLLTASALKLEVPLSLAAALPQNKIQCTHLCNSVSHLQQQMYSYSIRSFLLCLSASAMVCAWQMGKCEGVSLTVCELQRFVQNNVKIMMYMYLVLALSWKYCN